MTRYLLRPVLGAALALALCGAAPSTRDTPPSAPPAPRLLPDRLVACVLGRATNIDTKKDQKFNEIIREGSYPFALHLPPIPVRTGPPPEAFEAPEPVDPRTKIVVDSGGLTKKFPNRFDRVVDYWPERVEMTTTIDDPLVNLIIISDIDERTGTANLFMTEATDVATFDMKHIYQGSCKFAIKTG